MIAIWAMHELHTLLRTHLTGPHDAIMKLILLYYDASFFWRQIEMEWVINRLLGILLFNISMVLSDFLLLLSGSIVLEILNLFERRQVSSHRLLQP